MAEGFFSRRGSSCKGRAGPIAWSGRLRGQTAHHLSRQAGRLGKLAPLRYAQTCPADFPPPDKTGSAGSTGQRALYTTNPGSRRL
ncbi:hypothetical protein GCM10027288_40700 [Bordetella tumbae]